MNGNNGDKATSIIIIVMFVIAILIGFASCGGGGSSSSSYQLHNKDGSINWEYYSDMQDYFAKHPEKLP